MSGLQLTITNEEADVLAKFDNLFDHISKSTFSEREQVIANQLVNKGVLIRKNQNGQINYYKQVQN
jgi:hypothetical protein